MGKFTVRNVLERKRDMNEVLFYRLFDVVCTVLETIDMILLMSIFTKEDIRSRNNIGIGICYLVIVVTATYCIPIMSLKSVMLAAVFGIIWNVVKKQSCLKGIALSELSLGLLCAVQTMVNLIESFFWNNPSFDMGNFYIGHWQWTTFLQIACLSLSIIIYYTLRNFYFKWETKDLILVGITGLTELIIGATSLEKLLREGVEEKSGLFFSSCLFWVIIFLIIHFQQTSQLREKEEKERLRLQSLELEVTYFQEKTKEEEKVRKLYHDMKNVLLAAKLCKEDTALLDNVEQDLEEYGHYYESGNTILNVILKEKMKMAKDKEIDMQADVDFTEGNFIKDRDIIIIFGNALDNAIEASEKLPADEALITVKAGKIRNMLSIIFENNMADELNPDFHTIKEDIFLHGFGITNIKESVERYGGTCILNTEAKRFLLQILIPVP